MAMAAIIFLSLPSSTTSAFLHRNPNPSSSSSALRGFPPLSLFLHKTRHAIAPPRRPVAAASAVGLDLTVERGGPDGGRLLDISQLGISEQIVSALSRRGITELFPIQRAVLEPAMEGRDMIGRAITGSGKTLAFGIPILDKIIRHNIQHRKKRVPSALVLAPTRELARQVQREFKESAPNLSSTCLYGGVPIINQVRMLGPGIDIAVGTPGRIIDLVERGALNLSEVKFVVLDEADQMLAVGFQEDVECILGYLPAKKQCMLFSATMPSWVNEISKKFLRNPVVIDLVGESDQKLADGISLYSISSTTSQKQDLLPVLISRYAQGGKSLIFTRTRNDAEELSRSMRNIIGSRALHGNMQQLQRDRTLAAFCDGQFNVLVATDVAARGLDIPNVDLVIHFEMPNTSENFVHRSGRTGRAGKTGNAVLIFTERQRRAVRLIERDLRCKFEELPKTMDGVVVGRKVSRDGRGSFFDNYDASEMRQDRSLDRRSENYGRSQPQNFDYGKSKQLYSNASKFSGKGTSGGHGLRKNGFERISRPEQRQHAKSRRPQTLNYDAFEVDQSAEGGVLPYPDRFRKSPRSTTSRREKGIESDHSDRYFGEDVNTWEGKRRPSISESSPDDFERILNLFGNHH